MKYLIILLLTVAIAIQAKEENRMIEKEQLRNLIQITLKEFEEETKGKVKYSEPAVELLMMTAAHESKLGSYIEQMNGPALGIFQMEPATEADIWDNYLYYRPELELAISSFSMGDSFAQELKWNLKYAIVMARIHYYRVPSSLPKDMDSQGAYNALAVYAKKYYNTDEGKATASKYLEDYESYAI